MATQNELEVLLENASEQELAILAFHGCQYAETHPEMSKSDIQEWGGFMSLIAIEAERRKIEPLWRKAKRFTVRNSGTFKEIGKIAAGVALGIFVGDSLTS